MNPLEFLATAVVGSLQQVSTYFDEGIQSSFDLLSPILPLCYLLWLKWTLVFLRYIVSFTARFQDHAENITLLMKLLFVTVNCSSLNGGGRLEYILKDERIHILVSTILECALNQTFLVKLALFIEK